MKYSRSITMMFFLIFGFAIASFVHAEKVEVNGVDMTPVIERFKRQVRVVKKPFHVYHWGNDPNYSNGNPSATDKKGFDLVQRGARAFLDSLEHVGRANWNYYGGGFYSSVDPMATESYGGYNWIVIDSQIPVGFRMLDLRYNTVANLPYDSELYEGFAKALKKLGCEVLYPKENEGVQYLLQLNRIDHTCAEGIRAVFKNLKIDALAYDYNGTGLKNCRRSGYSDGPAFVFTSGDWLKDPSQIHIFTENTTDAKTERIAFESVFIYTNSDADAFTVRRILKNPTASMKAEMAESIKRRRPDIGSKFTFQYLFTTCVANTDNCMITVEVSYLAKDGSKNKSTFKIPPPHIEYSGFGEITANSKVNSLVTNGLHWQDLIGSKIVDVPQWQADNILDCGPTDNMGKPGDF